MPSKFVAIPVNAGDSFYLQRGDHSILVDGGKRRAQLPILLKQLALYKDSYDLVVCTHNDKDHSNGLIGLLETPHFSCKELWLPSIWLSALIEAARESRPALLALAKDLQNGLSADDEREVDRERLLESQDKVLENFAKDYKLEEFSSEQLSENSELGWPIEVIDYVESQGSMRSVFLYAAYNDYLYSLHYLRQMNMLTLSNLSHAHNAFERIRRIAAAAINKNIPVRWFKHDPANPSLLSTGLLKPISCREVPPTYYAGATLLMYTALSTINVESLVFISEVDNGDPSVLFMADSDLSDSNNTSVVLNDALVTAPHHGSETNASAYPKIKKWSSGELTWVRSDGEVKRNPGNEYLKQSHRYCTICNTKPGFSMKRKVEFSSVGASWVAGVGNNLCGCQ